MFKQQKPPSMPRCQVASVNEHSSLCNKHCRYIISRVVAIKRHSFVKWLGDQSLLQGFLLPLVSTLKSALKSVNIIPASSHLLTVPCLASCALMFQSLFNSLLTPPHRPSIQHPQ